MSRLRPLAFLGLVILGSFLGPGRGVHAQNFGSPEPEPFRGKDTIEDRDFDYDDESFLHRFSYRFRTARLSDWYRTREGVRGTAGSVSSDELYVFEEVRKTITLDGPLFFSIRQKRDEDFDSRYDRVLLGAGFQFEEHWYASAHADVDADKEDIDLHLELAWSPGEKRGVRAAFLAVDWLYNDKSPEGQEYSRKPFTYFLEGMWRWDRGTELQGWVNYNSDLRLELPTDGFDFTYNQFEFGVRASTPISHLWSVWGEVRGETGDRDRRPFTAGNPIEKHLSRRHWQATVELRRRVREDFHWFVGARYFYLKERDARPNDLALDGDVERNEHFLYLGSAWRLHERVLVWPTIYLDFIDNAERFDFNPGLDDRDNGFVGKFAVPVEVRVWEDATVTGNLTFALHEPEFGGANVQIQIPF